MRPVFDAEFFSRLLTAPARGNASVTRKSSRSTTGILPIHADQKSSWRRSAGVTKAWPRPRSFVVRQRGRGWRFCADNLAEIEGLRLTIVMMAIPSKLPIAKSSARRWAPRSDTVELAPTGSAGSSAIKGLPLAMIACRVPSRPSGAPPAAASRAASLLIALSPARE
jgi:hypothetical protein